MSTELSTLGSVIKTAYEAEADTNAYTDAEKAKLAAVEALADVTDATNVTAAGALMDSEVANLAAVKAFDPTDYATAAQGSTADSALQAVSDDTTPTLGGALDAGGFNISNLGDVLFKTGATGGTLRTGTSNADKFQLQGYDVDGAAYRTVLEVDAGNDVRLQLPVVYLDLEDATDTTKIAKFDASGITTGTTRTFAFPDASGTFALSDNIEGTAIKSTGEVGASKFLREDGDGTCSWQSVPASGGDLLADGTVPLTANWDVGAFAITALQFHSDITTGTAPFTVASSTVVTNLNADLLDGNEASAFAAAAHNHDSDYISVVGTPTAGNFPQLTAGGELVNSAYDETSFATAAQANATHSGDAVGDTSLTLQPAAITGKGAVTVAGADHVLVVDDSASPQTLGKTTAQAVADLAKPTESIIVACSDETTALTTGTAKVTFRMPYAFTLTEVRATVTTAPVGSSIIVDINEKVGIPSPDVATSILSTRLYIDAGEFSSEDASVSPAHQSVISDTSLADDSEITIDIDQIGASTAGAGLKVELIGKRT